MNNVLNLKKEKKKLLKLKLQTKSNCSPLVSEKISSYFPKIPRTSNLSQIENLHDDKFEENNIIKLINRPSEKLNLNITDESVFVTKEKPKKQIKLFNYGKTNQSKSKKNTITEKYELSHQSSREFDLEHVQLALAMSNSLQNNIEQENNEEAFPNTQQKVESLRETLLQFGFNAVAISDRLPTSKVNTQKRKKKRIFKTCLLVRTEEDRKKIIADKVSQILTNINVYNNHKSKNSSCKIIDEKPLSFVLREIYNSEKTIYNKCATSDTTDRYYSSLVNLKDKANVGALLRDWHSIPGRETTPPRSISSTENLQKFNTDVNTDFPVDQTICNSFKDDEHLIHNETVLKTNALSYREQSPDLFSEEESSDKVNCNKKYNLSPDIFHYESFNDNHFNVSSSDEEKTLKQNYIDLTQSSENSKSDLEKHSDDITFTKLINLDNTQIIKQDELKNNDSIIENMMHNIISNSQNATVKNFDISSDENLDLICDAALSATNFNSEPNQFIINQIEEGQLDNSNERTNKINNKTITYISSDSEVINEKTQINSPSKELFKRCSDLTLNNISLMNISNELCSSPKNICEYIESNSDIDIKSVDMSSKKDLYNSIRSTSDSENESNQNIYRKKSLSCLSPKNVCGLNKNNMNQCNSDINIKSIKIILEKDLYNSINNISDSENEIKATIKTQSCFSPQNIRECNKNESTSDTNIKFDKMNIEKDLYNSMSNASDSENEINQNKSTIFRNSHTSSYLDINMELKNKTLNKSSTVLRKIRSISISSDSDIEDHFGKNETSVNFQASTSKDRTSMEEDCGANSKRNISFNLEISGNEMKNSSLKKSAYKKSKIGMKRKRTSINLTSDSEQENDFILSQTAADSLIKDDELNYSSYQSVYKKHQSDSSSDDSDSNIETHEVKSKEIEKKNIILQSTTLYDNTDINLSTMNMTNAKNDIEGQNYTLSEHYHDEYNYGSDDLDHIANQLAQDNYLNQINSINKNDTPLKMVTHSRISELKSTSRKEIDTLENMLENGDLSLSENINVEEKTPDGKGSACSSDLIIKTSNITPKTNYNDMDTPKRNKELDKFGLKPMSKGKSVKILEYLYDATHPICNDEETNLENEVSSDTEPASKRRKREPKGTLISNRAVRNRHSQRICINDNKEEKISLNSHLENVTEDELIFERTFSRKIASCRLPFHIAWHNFLSTQPHLLNAILLYEPIQLEEIYLHFKTLGFKYHIQDITTFLDKKCITIRTAQNN